MTLPNRVVTAMHVSLTVRSHHPSLPRLRWPGLHAPDEQVIHVSVITCITCVLLCVAH